MKSWLKKTKMARRMSSQRIARRNVRRQLIIEQLDARLPLAIETQLVKDIDSQPENQGSDPTNFVQIGSSLYFAASTNGTGIELWKSDGTAAGTVMVKDIRVGRSDSSPFKLTNVNGTLYFLANDGTYGIELWKSDGTDTGTSMVKDIWVGGVSSMGSTFSSELGNVELMNVNGTLYFQASDGTSGVELWKSDGTTAGTTMVKDIGIGSISSSPSLLTNVNGTLFFKANDGSFGQELWKSDGTSVGTLLVKDIRAGSLWASPGSLTNVNGTLFFRANNGTNGYELWKSDGTNAGTVMVKDISAGSSYPINLTNSSGALYFFVFGTLYKSDGTDGGTTIVKSGFRVDSSPIERALLLTNINGTLYFRANDGTNGNELWKSDGTTVGTMMVKDIQAGNYGIPREATFTNINGDVFFQANDGTTGVELWKSNGTAAGTVRVKDIRPGATSSFSFALSPFKRNVPINFNGTIYFSASDGVSGLELWKSDGTQAGTLMVKNIRLGTGSPRSLTNVNGTIYLRAADPINGAELWKSDGTAAGTVIVKDIVAGVNGYSPNNLTNVNGSLFFATHDGINGLELWKSDGSASGTQMVRDIRAGSGSSGPASLTNVNGTLFFNANDGSSGDELWKSDGTSVGTVLVKDIRAGSFRADPDSLTNVNGTLFFSANDGSKGEELWKSDGTNAGTVIVKDIRPGLNSSLPRLLTNVGGTLFFIANDGTSGYELWKSDGTIAGTVMVNDVSVGSRSSNPSRLTNINGILYFQATNLTNGYELWRSDGTASGTLMVKDIRVGSSSSGALSFTEVNGTVFFSANDGANGYELWRSDGTPTGTMLVRDILPGSNGSAPKFLTNFNGTLYFSADDGNGFTFWKSDGTDAGTRSLGEFVPRESIFDPNNLFAMGGTLYYTMVYSDFGDELWKLFEIANRAPTDIRLSSTQIIENAGANTAIGTLSTTDPDAGDTFTYTLVTGSGDADNAAFNISGSSLRATNSFDFETKSSYTVRVRSTDQGGLFTEKVFTIAVTNVNETPADIALTNQTIAENAGTNATVGILSTIDPDVGNTFTYILVNGAGDTDNDVFNISGSTLRATNNFDFETKSSYTVRVRSTDQGGLFIEKVFMITVTDVNESPTDIDLSPKSIAENAGANATVGTLSTIDQDSGNTFTYTFATGSGDADNASFSINGSTLRATNSFDFETKSSYTVRVRSTDQGGLFIEKAITIAVTNVNETPTDINLLPRSIAENAGANATVGALTSTDPDVGNTFTYTLVTGTGDADNAAFNISGSSLRATNSFDFETKSSYNVRVRSTDQGGLFTEKVFTIAVTDVNDSPTDIDLSPRSIAENAGANVTVGTLSTIDQDAGNTFTYTFAAGSGDTDNAVFNISGSSLRATNNFDFETKSSYTVRVRSTDQGGLFTEKAFTITVTNVNETPTDVDLSPKSIAENAGANATVGALTSTDPDVGNTFTYTLVTGSGDADNAAFNISGSSLRATNNFDFETKSSYTVRIRATDQGGLFIEKVFTIAVTDVNELPTDIDLSPKSIAENAGANATVGTLSTIDQDARNTFTYTFEAGAGDADNAAFNISGSSLRATNSFDFETKSSYTVRVRSTDQGGLFVEKAITIAVTNVNETPTDINLLPKSIAENAGANATVGALSTTDPDVGNTFTYTLVTGTGDADNAAFNITGSSLRATSSFDFETKASYTVRVRSTDQGGLFTEKAFAITVTDVNETPTDVDLSPKSIAENAGANATVGALTSTDPDVGNTFTYTLVTGTGDADNGAFNITGSSLRATNNFDFETKSSYTVRVRSTDQGGLFSEKAITIAVTDVNESPTDIDLSPKSIAENAGANATVGTLSTIDQDARNTFTYTFEAGAGDADNAAFNISGSSLRATNSFDFETKSSYTVRVRSTDQGGLFVEKAITIAVTNVNETPTDINLLPKSIAENAGANATVGALTSTDPDVGNTFTYTLVTGTGDADNAAFNISGSSLRATSSFDFETKSSYTVRIRATDQGGLFTEKSFAITVTDVNETPTDIALSPKSIAENAGANATVGTLSTIDQDAGNTFTYTFAAGAGDTDNASFSINGSTLRATNIFDFETKSSYTVRVRSTDQGVLFVEKAFTIAVNNVNETPTDINLLPKSIAENSGANAIVGTLTTTDQDAGNSFTYSLVVGTGDADNSAFNMSGATLRATGNFDFETKSSYTVRVRSTDQGGLFVEKAFTIAVTNVNEAPTDIDLSPQSIAENAGANARVGTLSTIDPDAANTFTYTLVVGTGDADNAAFNISGSTLRATNSFDFANRSIYTARIRSTDQAGLFTEKAFTITVTNVNGAPTDINLSPSTLAENAGANAAVGTLSTTDPDPGDLFTYMLVAGIGDTDNSAFNIFGSTFRATNSFDFEIKSSYSVRVRSTDRNGLFTEKLLTINVSNVNESPIDIALSPATIAENAGANATVGTLSTTDPDAANTFIYTLIAGTGATDNAAFSISGSTLRATNSFDFETQSSYSVRVRSTDQGGLFAERQLTITVSNVNEAPTDIDLSSKTIAENAGTNATVGTLSTVDQDAANTFIYTLVNGTGDTDNAAFNISGSALRATNSFDFETKSSYTVRIRSTDQGGLFTEKQFTIAVNNVNDTPTDIDVSPKMIAENSGENASVGTFNTTDQDAASSFIYTLVTGTGDADNSAFNFSGSTLRATNNFDFETKSIYTVRIRSTDQGGLFTEKTFTIAVANVNESPIDIDLSSKTIAENSNANAMVGTLLTTDQDAASSFVYTLVTGTGDADNSIFNLSGSTLRATSNFDFETKSSYTVRVRSTDQGGLFIEKAFTIAVTNVNESPIDVDLSSKTIAENSSANATVGTLITTDQDAASSFVYTLVTGTGDADNSAFNMSGSTLRATDNFDFETKPSYTIRVRSTDQGGLFVEKAFTIAVTNVNEAPTDIDLSSETIAENAGTTATVGTLSTVDQDTANTFIYTLVNGMGDTDNAAFNISGSALRATNSFDFETKSSYAVRIRSTDQGGQFTEKQFTIVVINVNETPTDINLLPKSITENSGANAIVGTLTTTDQDAGNSFTYSLVVGTGDADNSAFNISGSTLRATNNFDFEKKSSYTIRVRSTDQVGLFTEKTFTIAVTNANESPTDIDLSSRTIAENAGAIATIGTLTTTDPDVGNSFTYTLVNGPGSTDNVFVAINGDQLAANSSFDFENKKYYTIRVRATDVDGLSFEKTFSISVTDVNEAPSLQLTSVVTSVPESNSTGLDVADVVITDDAIGANVIRLTGPEAAMFEVIGGKLKLKPSTLDFESKPSLQVTVSVDDPAVGATPDHSIDVVLSIANVPEVTGVIVIDGNGWLDSVRRVRVQWDMAVQLTNTALRWNKSDVENANVSFTTQTSVINGQTVADMQFLGKYSDEVGLLNGDYQLTVMGDQVTAVNSSLAGMSFADRFLALRPKSPFEMRIDLASPIGIGSSSIMNVQLVGLSEVGNGIRYQIDWNSDGVVDWTGLGGSSISIDKVSFPSGGSQTIRGEAIRSGQSIAKGSKVVDVVPFTKSGSNWFSTLDVDLDNTISPLDVLRVVNRLNDTSPATPYELRLDVDRDQSISPLDVLAIINHINSNPNSEPPTPFASISMTDTGASDGLTSNLSVFGVVKDPSSKLFASLDGKERREVVGAVGSNGQFNVTDAAMVLLFGDKLDGDHLLTLETVDSNGRRQAIDRQFTRISRLPSAFEIVTAVQNSGLSLAWTTAGNGLRYRVFRNVAGQSPQLIADGLSDLAAQVNLPLGLNELFVEAYDHIGNKSNSQTLRVQIS